MDWWSSVDNKLDALYSQWSNTRSESDLNELLAAVRKEAVSMCRTLQDAQDIAQNVLMAVLAKINSFTPVDDTAFTRWIRRMVRLERSGTRRNSYRHSTESLDEIHDSPGDEHQFFDTSGLPAFERAVANGILAGFTLGEIAGRLDMKPATLRKKLERVRHKTPSPRRLYIEGEITPGSGRVGPSVGPSRRAA